MPIEKTANQKRRTRKKARRKGGVYILLVAALICVAVWLTAMLFFRINRIEVAGLTKYLENNVVMASGIKEGDSPFFMDRESILGNILEEFPYVAEARLVHRLPATIVIEVTEREALGIIAQGSGCWLVDKDGRLLEQVSERTQKGKPIIRGLTLIGPAAGRDATVPGEQADRLSSALSLLNELERYGIIPDVSEVDVAMTHRLILTYDDGRFRVLLGDVGHLDIKLPFLLSAVKEISPRARGTLDVSRVVEQKAASYVPDTTPSP